MTATLTGTGISFSDGTTQTSATGMDFILQTSVSEGDTYLEFTGAFVENYRSKYRGLYVCATSLTPDTTPYASNLHLQMRWSDNTGNPEGYGWAISGGMPYRYPTNAIHSRHNVYGSDLYQQHDFNGNSILIGVEHANYSGHIEIIGLGGFGQTVISHGFGTNQYGDSLTIGSGKVEIRDTNTPPRTFDGFRLYWSGGAKFASGAMSVYGLRR